MSRSVVLYLVLLAVIIVFWVGGHQSILLNTFNCWLLRNKNNFFIYEQECGAVLGAAGGHHCLLGGRSPEHLAQRLQLLGNKARYELTSLFHFHLSQQATNIIRVLVDPV